MTAQATTIAVAPNDPRLVLAGVAELVADGGWWQPCRLPVVTRGLPIEPALYDRAKMSAGARLEFVTDAEAVELRVDTLPYVANPRDVAPYDVVVDGRLALRQTVQSGAVSLGGLGSATKRIEIWLPQFGIVRLGKLELRGARQLSAARDSRPRWVAYGSSITQCADAAGPTETWPALVARANGWNLTCLGFGGECHLDPVVARYIRDMPADLVSLCLGINIYGQATFSARSLVPAVIGFVQVIRDTHSSVPMTIMTPIASPDRETAPNAVGLTLAQTRAEIARAARSVQDAGSTTVRLIDGLDILGPAEAELLIDGLHPSAEGYRVMAERLAPSLLAAYQR